ncbi:MAG: N-succinylarginine dihydrolase, partial [Deltaproteobacteria bacterium]|nr:N-succinylarginine dihydrolase [Deltaproteobacteria bacterium]
DERKFAVHDPLPSNACYGDEGAANHARFADAHGAAGVELFIHGRRAFGAAGQAEPRRFAARQTLEASQAVARLHGLRDSATVHAQQNPEAIDAGAFHNDVVSVGNLDLLFYHEQAFADEKALLGELQAKFTKLSDRPLRALRVSAADVPLEDAVKSYLFNSQLLRLPDGKTLLLAPIECEENARVRAYLEGHVGKGSGLDRLEVVDLRESMQNGGGPACLRLRVALTDAELAAVNPGVLLDEAKLAELEGWVGRHYRDRLEAGELCDPKLVEEVETALDELTKILTLGSIYPFQS